MFFRLASVISCLLPDHRWETAAETMLCRLVEMTELRNLIKGVGMSLNYISVGVLFLFFLPLRDTAR